jgi:hypothetical protein
MAVILKINKGTAEKLREFDIIKPDESRNINEEELTLELNDKEILVELHKKDIEKKLEISDVNGSFGLWLDLNKEKVEKLKQVIRELGP